MPYVDRSHLRLFGARGFQLTAMVLDPRWQKKKLHDFPQFLQQARGLPALSMLLRVYHNHRIQLRKGYMSYMHLVKITSSFRFFAYLSPTYSPKSSVCV